MILTFTANPSVDRTAEVEALVPGTVMRTVAVRVDAGGKGVNVTRALHANGIASIAILPVGGHEGNQLLGLLQEQELRVRTVPIAGAVRANVTIAEPDGTTTKLNEPGPVLTLAEIDRLAAKVIDTARDRRCTWAVLAGSLPPGVPLDFYATLVRELHEHGVRVAVDCDGPLLRATLAAGPDLVKPNRRELAEATGVGIDSPEDAVLAARGLMADGAGAVLASLGHRGAILVEDATGPVHHASSAVAAPRSTVGAGDASLAGFLAAGATGPAALVEAVTWGAAAVGLPGSRMPGPADLRRTDVTVAPLPDPSRPSPAAVPVTQESRP
jgi:1-phosphofructokinase